MSATPKRRKAVRLQQPAKRSKGKTEKQKRNKAYEKNRTIKSLEETISELQGIIVEKEEWIERLLEYTELSKEDIEKDLQRLQKIWKQVVEKYEKNKGMPELIHHSPEIIEKLIAPVIIDLANKVAEQAIKIERNIHLDPMNAYDRRIVHTTLQGRDDVTTESTGEGEKRHVVIKPTFRR